MNRIAAVLTAAILVSAALHSQSAIAQDGPYKVLATTKVGGDGGMDYLTADSVGRRLYIARSGQGGRITVFNLDTLAPTGEIPNVSAHGAAVDLKYGTGIATAKPVPFFDAKTLAVIKTIDVQGNPDGYLVDQASDRFYILSHQAPNVTVIDAKDGSILGTIDLGGQPEEAVTDGKGHLYIDLEDKKSIAVVDSVAMKLTGTYDISSKGGGCAGLAMDVKNSILFASCHDNNNMIILDAKTGKILDALPTGSGSDGATFNPATMEAFSSQGDGTLTIVKENSPTSFVVEQNVKTPSRAKTLTLDAKTGKIFLITAEYGPAPAPTPPPADAPAGAQARPGRAPMIPGTFMIVTVGK